MVQVLILVLSVLLNGIFAQAAGNCPVAALKTVFKINLEPRFFQKEDFCFNQSCEFRLLKNKETMSWALFERKMPIALISPDFSEIIFDPQESGYVIPFSDLLAKPDFLFVLETLTGIPQTSNLGRPFLNEFHKRQFQNTGEALIFHPMSGDPAAIFNTRGNSLFNCEEIEVLPIDTWAVSQKNIKSYCEMKLDNATGCMKPQLRPLKLFIFVLRTYWILLLSVFSLLILAIFVLFRMKKSAKES